MNDVKEFLNELAQEPKTGYDRAPEDLPEKGQLAIDLYKADDSLILEAAIGGVKSDELDIEITNNSVVIEGRRHRDHRTHKRNYIIDECHWGGFSRSVELPEEIDADTAQATIKNGILRIVMPLFR